jgi:hypothetical protein
VAGEPPRRLGVRGCVGKRGASGGAGGPDGEAGAAREQRGRGARRRGAARLARNCVSATLFERLKLQKFE